MSIAIDRFVTATHQYHSRWYRLIDGFSDLFSRSSSFALAGCEGILHSLLIVTECVEPYHHVCHSVVLTKY
jgi:hypothetical protein